MHITLTPEEQALWRLSSTEGIGPLTAHALIQHFGSAAAVLSATAQELLDVPGLSRRLMQKLRDPDAERRVSEELQIISEEQRWGYPITPIFYGTSAYPVPLTMCVDAPLTLYARGTIDPHAPMIAVVGTRHATSYSEQALHHIITEWAKVCPQLIIVSGLAYGVDTMAHTIAMEAGLRTIAVVAHGHYTIYPSANQQIARQIVERGGAILTEYPYRTRALPSRFIARNRIVAGLSRATLVAESKAKGGALVTANIAFDYSRYVYALPGRIFDQCSHGCNALIETGKAAIVSSPTQLLTDVGILTTSSEPKPTPLPFVADELRDPIVALLAAKGILTIEDLSAALAIEIPALAARLFELELDAQIVAMPGGRYSISHHTPLY